jgi:hypothetical protein
MGYDLHLVRTSVWTDSEIDPIPEGAWVEVASSSLTIPTGIAVEGGPTVYQLRPRPDAPTLQWDRGQVTVWGATDADVDDLVHLADRLDARLVGDDGESYPQAKRSRWRRRR